MGINRVTILCPLVDCKYNEIWFEGQNGAEPIRYCNKDDLVELFQPLPERGKFKSKILPPKIVCIAYAPRDTNDNTTH